MRWCKVIKRTRRSTAEYAESAERKTVIYKKLNEVLKEIFHSACSATSAVKLKDFQGRIVS